MIKLKHIPLIEYHLVNHCNLNCKGCAHFAPLAKPWFADINEFEKDLNQLSSKVIIDKLTLFGGEPLLNEDIDKFLIVARKILPNADISVLTNGVLLLKKLSGLVKTMKDNHIYMDITCYPINVDYELELKMLKTLKIPYRIYNDLERIKTLRHHCLSHKKETNDWDCLMINSNSVQLRNGKLYICPLQAYIDIFNNYFNENFKLNNDCYLDIYNCTDKQIVSMYHTKNSFCEYCREPIEGNKYSTSKKEKTEWM